MTTPSQISASVVHRPPWRCWLAVFLLSTTIANAIVFWKQKDKIAAGYGDFASFYAAGLMVRHGLGRDLYDRSEQWKVQQEFAPHVETRKGPLPYVRPPFEALLFLPLSYLSFPAALSVWSFAKLAVLLLALAILRRPFGRIYSPVLETVFCLGFFPVFLDLLQGQDSIFFLLLVVLAFNRLLLGRDAAAGAFLGLGLFKFNLVLPMMLVLVLAGRRRVLKGFMPVMAAYVALSCAVAGPRVLVSYPAYLLTLNRSEGVGFITAQNMPNLRGILTAAVGTAPYPGSIHWFLLPIAIAALVYTARIWRPQIGETMGLVAGYCLALIVSILTSYYAYPYDMNLLLLPLLVLGAALSSGYIRNRFARILLIAGFLLLLCTPLYWELVFRMGLPYLLTAFLGLVAAGLTRELTLAARFESKAI